MFFRPLPRSTPPAAVTLSAALAVREDLLAQIDLALDIWRGIGHDDALVERLNALRLRLLDVQAALRLWEVEG